MPRGMALAWFVFAGKPLLFATYLLALALNYIHCVASTAIYRRVREIPRRRLVWDIACVILGVLLSTFEDFLLQFGSPAQPVLPLAGEHAFAGSCMCSNSRTVVRSSPPTQRRRACTASPAGYTAPLAWQAARELWTSGAAGLAGETLAGVAACLGLSAYVCTQHVPERWSPGRYDLVGQSHQVRCSGHGRLRRLVQIS